LVGGGLGGAIPTGTHLRAPYNAPLGSLFLTLLAGLGVPAARFGDDGSAPLALAATIHKPYWAVQCRSCWRF